MKTIALIVIILILGWTSLYLYFDWRQDKKYEEFKKRLDNFKDKIEKNGK